MSRESVETGSLIRRVIGVAVCMVVVAGYLNQASRAEELPPREPLARLPMTIDDWSGRREADFTDQIEAILGVDDYIVRTYASPNAVPIGLYIGYHTSQRQGDTIHSPLNCLPGAGWTPIAQGRTVIPLRTSPDSTATTPVEVNRVIIAKGLDRQLVFYWYQSHRRVVASEYWGKIYTVLDSVRYNRTDAALVRVIAPVPDGMGAEDIEKRTIEFIQSLFPLLPRHLPS